MRRVLVALGVLALIVGVAVAPPTDTLASWTRNSYAQGGFSALTVPPPTLGATCTLTPGFLGTDPVITITWSLPAGYAFGDVRYGYYNVSGLEVLTGPLLGYVTTTGGPTYTTKFSAGLLGGLLGGSKSVGMVIRHSSGWTSKWATVTASMAALGANPQCTVNPIV